MTDLEIWCLGDINYFVAVLNSLAMLAQSGLLYDLVKLGMILAGLYMVLQMVFMGTNTQGGLPWGRFIIAWAMFQLLFGSTVRVWVYDTYTLKSIQVDNVPYGVAMAGSVTSKIAHEITDTLEQAFSTPTLKDGFAAPLQTLLKARKLYDGLGLPQNGNVQKTLTEYAQKCTQVGINLGLISMENMKYQENPWQAMKFESGIYWAQTWLPGDPPGGTTRTCSDAWNFIDNYLSANLWDDWQGYLKTVFCDSNDAACVPLDKVQTALDAATTVSQNAQYYMLAAVLLPVLEDGQMNAANEFGKPEQAVVIGQAREQRNAQWLAESSLFANIMRPLMAFFEGFLYAVAPFMALLVAFVPSGLGLILKFFAMFIWIQMWMPVMAIINQYLQIIMQQKLSSMVIDGLIPLTSIQGQLTGMSNMNDWLATAGMLISSTPAISLALIYGGAITMTHLAGRMQHGDFVNEKSIRPDIMSSTPLTQTQAMRLGPNDVYGSRMPGAEAVAPKIEVSEIAASQMQSSAAEMSTATQTFGKTIGQMRGHSVHGGLTLSNSLQSMQGMSASSAERYSSQAAFGQMMGHDLGKSQTDSQTLGGLVAANAAAGGGMAGLQGSVTSKFDAQTAQQVRDYMQSHLNLSGNKDLTTAIDEKVTSDFARGQTRDYGNVFRQEDMANVQRAAQKVEQAQKQYSETQQTAKRVGMSQSVSSLAYGKMGASGLAGMSSREFMMQNRRIIHPGDVHALAKKYMDPHGPYKLSNPEQARWAAIGELLNRQSNNPGDLAGDRYRAAESGKLLLGLMDRMGLMAPDTGDALKHKGIVDTGKVGAEGEHAKQASMDLKGPGDVPGAIQQNKGQILEPQSQREVRNWGEGQAAGIRSQLEEQRMDGVRRQHGEMLDGNMREFEQNKSSSQQMVEISKGALRGMDTATQTNLLALTSGGASLSKEKALKVWNQSAQQVWGGYFQKGKELGLDDNLSKVYAHGAMFGWGIAAKEHAGLSLPMPKEYEKDRAMAVQARSQHLQDFAGYSPEAARQRAQQEVFLVEKAGQTGMDNWAAKIPAADKSFSQAHETRERIGPNDRMSRYEPIINQASQRYHVPQELVRSVMRAESRGNPRAVSPDGAMGLMQIMPGTAEGLARQLSTDFRQTVTKDMVLNNSYWNTMAGTKYLAQNLSQFGNTEQAVSAYHRGPEAVSKGRKPGPKNRAYVAEVMKSYNLSRSFSATPAHGAESTPASPAPDKMQPQTVQRFKLGPSPANAAEIRNNDTEKRIKNKPRIM